MVPLRHAVCALAFAAAAAPALAQTVILDQIGPNGALLPWGGGLSGYFHQFSTPPVGFGNRATIDDFILTAPMRITSIEVVLGSLPGSAVNWNSVPAWRVEVYSNPQIALNNNLTGDLLHSVLSAPAATTTPYGPFNFGPNPMILVRADVDLNLDAGMYWATILPQNAPGNGYGVMMGSSAGNQFIVWQILPGQTALPIQQPGLGIRITGEAAAGCYPDCNEDGALTVSDFGCFQTRFVTGDPYADCNEDTMLTVADFGCFQTEFVAGCP